MEKQLNNLIEKMTEVFINNDEKEKEILSDKFIEFIVSDTTQDEKRVLIKSLFEEVSAAKTVREYINAENVLLKFYHILGLSLGVGCMLIFFTALFFSDHFLINHINTFLENLFYFLGFGGNGVDK